MLTLMGLFFKKDVLEQADSYPKLASLDPCDKKNQVHCKHVECGFAARQSLTAVTDNKTISELAVLIFKTECAAAFSHVGQAYREVSFEVSTCEISLLTESSQDDQLG